MQNYKNKIWDSKIRVSSASAFITGVVKLLVEMTDKIEIQTGNVRRT